jgi:chromosomal replication initiator protein
MSLTLDRRLTFESFVVGPSNRLAAAAARRIAESPGTSYNPLVIHGGAGLGKTHLLNAVGHHAILLQPEGEVVNETLESFVEALTAAIGGDALPAFRERFARPLLFLLDDVQFLEGKGRTQEELLRLWDEMVRAGTQIVLASDRPPAEIDGLDERLISRFSGGLIVDVSAPDYDTRVAILRALAAERGVELAKGVPEEVARHAFESVRGLQGALNRIAAVQETEGRGVSASEAASLFGRPAPTRSEDEFSAFLDDISNSVAELVETAPWRRQLGEQLLRWEAEGFRTRRLDEALEADSAPDVDALVSGFAADAERLLEIQRELAPVDPRAAASDIFRDPDRVGEAEALLQAARRLARPLPAPPSGLTLEGLVRDHGEGEAVAAARQVIARPGAAYNPLYVHGGKGSGKTHLLAAIGAAVTQERRGARVAYLSGPELAAELTQALHAHGLDLWRRRYRSVDLLLLDDLDALEGDARTQEEAFYLLDSLLRTSVQVVLAGRKPPAGLTGLDERLRSRLEGGLVVDASARPSPGAALELEGASEVKPPPDVPARGAAVDSWFLDREKMALAWTGIDDRLVEELG